MHIMGLSDEVRSGTIMRWYPEDKKGNPYGFIRPEGGGKWLYFQDFIGVQVYDPVQYRMRRGSPSKVAFEIKVLR